MKFNHMCAVLVAAMVACALSSHAADLKFSALPAATTLAGTEALPGVQAGGNVKVSPAQIKTYVKSGLVAADVSDSTATGRSLLTAASTAAARAAISLVPGTDVEAHDQTLTALGAMSWSAGVQVPALTAADTWTLKTIGAPDLQPYNANLACEAGLTTAADKVFYWTGSGTCATTTVTSTARSLLDDTSITAMRATLAIDSYTSHGDSDFTITASGGVVATSAALTAPRTWILPAANSLNAGQALTLADVAQGITSTNTLTLARAGSDTINGATSQVLANAGSILRLISDGTSKWTFDVAGITRGGSGATTPAGARAAFLAAALGANSDITSLSGLTTALSVAQGGTGTTTSTGTGAVVRATSPALVTPALGAATATTLDISGTSLFPFSVTSVDDSASNGPLVIMTRYSASPAANDVLGGFQFNGNNSSIVGKNYGGFTVVIDSPTAGAETSHIRFNASQAGSVGQEGQFGAGLTVGAPTGGSKGIGTVNAAGAYYANGTVGVSCSGTPTASFASVNGIVTHC